jgi:hypothetical protein
VKIAAIVFAFSAACIALLAVFRFVDGSPAAGAILLVVALVQLGVAVIVLRLGTPGTPPV